VYPSTNLWYKGTDVDMMALPNPAMILPTIMLAKAVLPSAPVITAAPIQVTNVPMKAAYLLPSLSLKG
jgi:hypothetical protein